LTQYEIQVQAERMGVRSVRTNDWITVKTNAAGSVAPARVGNIVSG